VKISFQREKQMKGIKGETRKIYMALLSFYKSAISPMVRWSFVRAGFFLEPESPLDLIGVDGTKVSERIEVLELPIDEALIYPDRIALPKQSEMPIRRRVPV
jgi:hypothetical protein